MYTAVKDKSVVPGRNGKPIVLDNVVCLGTELTLLDCSHDSDTTETDHAKDVGVYCKQCKLLYYAYVYHKYT